MSGPSTHILHNLRANDSGQIRIFGATIDHHATIEKAVGEVRVSDAAFGKDLNVVKGSGEVHVDSNTIGHDMNIRDNTISFVFDNTVGHKGKCTGPLSGDGNTNSPTCNNGGSASASR